MLAFLLIVPLSWVGPFVLCRALAARRRIISDWKLSFLLASALWGGLLTATVEVASLVNGIDRTHIRVALIAWGVATLLAAWVVRSWVRRAPRVAAGPVAIHNTPPRPLWRDPSVLLLSGTVAMIVTLGAIAVSTPPTTWDAMTYHLPRIMHWMQERNVRHYPTTNMRQTEFGPWSGFAMMATFLVAGDDRFVCLVQWFAMTGSVIGGMFLADRLLLAVSPGYEDDGPRRRRAMALAAVLVVTIPIGIAQSMSAQNDYVVAFWLVCAMSFLVMLIADPANAFYACGLGAAVGLGILTKGTFLPNGGPIVAIGLLVVLVRSRRWWAGGRLVMIVVILIAAINYAHMRRNYEAFGSPLGSQPQLLSQRNAEISVSGTLSNVIRNLALYTGTGSGRVTLELNSLLRRANTWTGHDIDDPKLTFPYTPFAFLTKAYDSDGVANSIYPVAVAFVALLLFPVLRRQPGVGWAVLYVLAVTASFLGFCATVRWSPWHNRIHLSQLVLLMPFAAVILESAFRPPVQALMGVVFLTIGGWSFLNNSSHPINADAHWLGTPRESQYFLEGRSFEAPTRQAADLIVASGCDRIGWVAGFDTWEYPIWILLRNRGFHGDLRAFVSYHDSSTASRDTPANPCAVIVTEAATPADVATNYPVAVAAGADTVFFDTNHDHWFNASIRGSSGLTPLTAGTAEIPFDNGHASLSILSPRPGSLKLSGVFSTGDHQLLTGNRLTMRAVNTSASSWEAWPDEGIIQDDEGGYSQERAVNASEVELTIPSRGGAVNIALVLANRRLPPGVALRDLKWQWVPADPTWASVVAIQNPFGVGPPYFWLGTDPTVFQVSTMASGALRMALGVMCGPSLPGVPTRSFEISTPAGYKKTETYVCSPKPMVFDVPVAPGRTDISVTPLDKGPYAPLANHDPRTLLIAVRTVAVRLIPSRSK